MTKLTNLTALSLIALLGASTLGACSDDDDDDTVSVAGRAGASRGGTSNGNRAGENSEAGGPIIAGAPGSGGTTSTGGTLAAAGAEQGGGGAAGDGTAAGAAGEAGAAGAAGASAVAALTDAQILLVLDTLNQGEVEEAYAALPRLTSAEVKTFAQQMVMDHGSARQSVLTTADTLNLAPTPSEPQADLQGEAEAHVAMLRATSASALDVTYINLEVEGHAEALALLDDLAAAANAAQLKTLIATLRATVLQHYQDAQELQSML